MGYKKEILLTACLLVVTFIISATTIQLVLASTLEPWQPETMSVNIYQETVLNIRVNCENIVWDTAGVNALSAYHNLYGYWYTHDARDYYYSLGRLDAMNWYSTNFPNPYFDRDDNNGNGYQDEAEITMQAIPENDTVYYARYKFAVTVQYDFSGKIQISDQLSYWGFDPIEWEWGWQSAISRVRGNYNFIYDYPYNLLATRLDYVYSLQTINNNDIATKQILETKSFGSFVEYRAIEVSKDGWKHIEIDAVHKITSVEDFMTYKTLLNDSYMYILDYFATLNSKNSDIVNVMITFNRPISIVEYKELIELGVNVSSFEFRAIDSEGMKHTIGGSPKYNKRTLSIEEQFQIVNSIVEENCLTPLGITSIEAKVDRSIIMQLNNKSYILLVDIIPAILRMYIESTYNVSDIDVNLNDLYWVAEDLGII